MNTLSFSTIKELQELLKTKKISSRELVEHFVKRFEQFDPELGSALEVFDTESIMLTGSNVGPLTGIPGIIKDVIAQKNRKLTCASKILQGLVSTFDATAVARLKTSGALLVGRANCDEFAMGSSTETSAYKKSKNPWDHTRVPGGSSGGSAAAVAAGLVPWSLGTDTGGSIRQPAGLCGIVGSKPTYGRVSRYGLVAYASSLDQIGIFSRTVYDNALILSSIAGKDEYDATTIQKDAPDFTTHLNGKLPENCVIGVVENALYAQGIDPQVVKSIEQALAMYEKLGAKIKKISLPSLDYSAAAYFILSRAEAASNLSRFDGVRYGLRSKGDNLTKMYENSRHDGFGTEVKARIMVGNYVLSAGYAGQYYENAKKVQTLIRQELQNAFKECTVIIMPTSPAGAFKFDAFADDTLQMDLQDYFTCAFNLSGNPGVSIPCGFTQDNLPLGFQIIAAHEQESVMFQVAHAYENQTQWHKIHPKQYI